MRNISDTTIEDSDNTTSISTESVSETLIMKTNGTERMRILNDGKVGIGMDNPT